MVWWFPLSGKSVLRRDAIASTLDRPPTIIHLWGGALAFVHFLRMEIAGACRSFASPVRRGFAVHTSTFRSRGRSVQAVCSKNRLPQKDPSFLVLQNNSSIMGSRGRNSQLQSRALDGGAVSGNGKIGVLFVCLGNICRSPTAEAMFTSVVQEAGLDNQFEIDSCGTGGGNPDWYLEGGWSYHEGEDSDKRMAMAAKHRGIIITSESRPLKPEDLTRFDYIIGMDAKNIADMQIAGDYWSSSHPIPERYRSKLSLMTSYSDKFKGSQEVPDPYYSGPEGFETVLDLLEDSCSGLLSAIQESESRKS
ncbi:hypothetical protein BSKO_04034 [Bryopsis sp. KO-2023]|nr:hypothetical protein BSKO_04034 [Bryopsis sp. KO-2023]